VNINDVLELWAEVYKILNEADYILFLPLSMININPIEMDTTELRAWLFETYTICNDKEAYAALNNKIKESYKFTQLALRNKTLDIRESTFRQREEWFRMSRNL
jgi:hypothetical protein